MGSEEVTTPLADSKAFIQARSLTKSYGTILAVDRVDISVAPGEIVAIVGDNGAGKSTLVKMLAGAVVPDSGRIEVEGNDVKFHSPRDARTAGVETIYQDWALLPNLDVTANLFLGREIPARRPMKYTGMVSRRRMRRDATTHLNELRIHIPRKWGVPVEALSGGQQQSVAIARALSWASRLVIMDEPTAALGVKESAAVLRLVERIRDQGTSVVIISHILPHVVALADRVVVMRHGRVVAEVAAANVTHDELIALIVGEADFGTGTPGVEERRRDDV